MSGSGSTVFCLGEPTGGAEAFQDGPIPGMKQPGLAEVRLLNPEKYYIYSFRSRILYPVSRELAPVFWGWFVCLSNVVYVRHDTLPCHPDTASGRSSYGRSSILTASPFKKGSVSKRGSHQGLLIFH